MSRKRDPWVDAASSRAARPSETRSPHIARSGERTPAANAMLSETPARVSSPARVPLCMKPTSQLPSASRMRP
ncbi:hypothetical protein B5F44_14345 [Gordonibacter urolithinfaciens]|nr:hypothetical protein B5F44_14345 [Gordonibacter urolithinfaciens]